MVLQVAGPAGGPKEDRRKKWQPPTDQPKGLVLTTATGRATDLRSLNRMLTILCRGAKALHVRVHDLRHTHASLAALPGRRHSHNHGNARGGEPEEVDGDDAGADAAA